MSAERPGRRRPFRVLLALSALLFTIALPGGGATRRPGRRFEGFERVEWSATQPPVNETHIFQGGVNHRGRPVGFHSRPGGVDPPHARVVRVVRPPDRLGVYEAEVEIEDVQAGRGLGKRSTFYPDRLDRAAVIAAIVHAYAGRGAQDGMRFRGPSGLGFNIEGYLLAGGRINTAYPLR
jgi:hypothetical protein